MLLLWFLLSKKVVVIPWGKYWTCKHCLHTFVAVHAFYVLQVFVFISLYAVFSFKNNNGPFWWFGSQTRIYSLQCIYVYIYTYISYKYYICMHAHTYTRTHTHYALQDLHHSLRSLSKFFTGHFSYPVVIFHDMLTRYEDLNVCTFVTHECVYVWLLIIYTEFCLLSLTCKASLGCTYQIVIFHHELTRQ
jgi:hypothetical protein